MQREEIRELVIEAITNSTKLTDVVDKITAKTEPINLQDWLNTLKSVDWGYNYANGNAYYDGERKFYDALNKAEKLGGAYLELFRIFKENKVR